MSRRAERGTSSLASQVQSQVICLTSPAVCRKGRQVPCSTDKDCAPLAVLSAADSVPWALLTGSSMQHPSSASCGETRAPAASGTAAAQPGCARRQRWGCAAIPAAEQLPATRCSDCPSAHVQAAAAFLKAHCKVLSCRQLSSSGSVFFFSSCSRAHFSGLKIPPKHPRKVQRVWREPSSAVW